MRLEGRIKMGFYPTPTETIKRIKTFLCFPEEKISILDPCCGDGLALKELASGKNGKTYGIELDNHRSDEAKKHLNFVLNTGIENARITNDCFSCLFLNPPYDWQDENDCSERKEKIFLKETIKYLQPGGILIYIIPQTRLDNHIAKILSYRFENINVYKFPDKEYDQFKQIVVFGTKKSKTSINNETQEFLIKSVQLNLEEIPCLETPIYSMPASKDISIFKSTLINEESLEKELLNSALWKKIQELSTSDQNKLDRPPLPLHTGHIGLLLANGYLDGVIGEGQDRHIVKGKVEKLTTKYVEEKENGVFEERELERFRVTIKILKQDGEIINLV